MAKKNSEKQKNYFDVIVQFITDFIDQRFKIKQRVDDVKKATIDALYKLKLNFMKTIVESLLLFTGLLALIAGVLLVLRDYFPLKYILLGYGLIVTILVLLRTKLKV